MNDRPSITRDTLLQEISRALREACPDRAEELIRETERRLSCGGETKRRDEYGCGHITHTHPDGYEVWFKFGCAHITGPDHANGDERDYLHVCDSGEFIRWLAEAWEAPKSSVEGGT